MESPLIFTSSSTNWLISSCLNAKPMSFLLGASLTVAKYSSIFTKKLLWSGETCDNCPVWVHLYQRANTSTFFCSVESASRTTDTVFLIYRLSFFVLPSTYLNASSRPVIIWFVKKCILISYHAARLARMTFSRSFFHRI